MCFELDSLPPIPVLSGGAPVVSADVTLEAADGNRFAAFVALPDEPGPVGVVVLPDVRGLYRFYEELALRFAERGYPAIAFDYFGRTAGVAKRDDGFPYMDHVAQTTPEGIQRDTRAAVEYLRSPAGGSCTVDFHGRLLLRRPERLARGGRRSRSGRGDRLLRLDGGAKRPTRADATGRASSRRRSSRCRRVTTRTSCRSTTPPSRLRSRPPASSTSSSSTTERRTASSTGATRSTRARRRTRGSACSTFIARHAVGRLSSPGLVFAVCLLEPVDDRHGEQRAHENRGETGREQDREDHGSHPTPPR